MENLLCILYKNIQNYMKYFVYIIQKIQRKNGGKL